MFPKATHTYYIHSVLWLQGSRVWELSIILPKEEAELFLQIIFLCILSYAWVFWELLKFPSVSEGWFVTSLTVSERVFNIELFSLF